MTSRWIRKTARAVRAPEKTRRPYSFGPGARRAASARRWMRQDVGETRPDCRGTVGRIGIAISRQDSGTVYAIVEVSEGRYRREKKKLEASFGNTVNDPTFHRMTRVARGGKSPSAPAGAPRQAPQLRGRGPAGGVDARWIPANDLLITTATSAWIRTTRTTSLC